jgi:gamma-glutamylputrescine oxidase
MSLRSSYYQATSPAPRLPTLEAAVDTHTCVVGGGFAGLNSALGLAERGQRDVVLLEASEPGFGASGRNGGFVFGGFSLGEASLLKDLGPERARRLRAGTQEGMELIRRRIREHAIECEAVQEGVLLTNWFKDPQVLRERQALLSQSYGQALEWVPQEQLRQQVHTERYHDALFEPDAFHFHPLKYAHGLTQVAQANGVKVYGNSPAIRLKRTGATWAVHTPSGTVRAQHVVLACGGYLAGLDARVDRSVLPIATYVMVTEPLGDRLGEVLKTRAAIYDTRFAFDYYRPLPDTRILWGGRISVLDRSAPAVKRLLYRDMVKVFPQLEGVGIDYAWSGLMSYARHQMPQVGLVEPGLWVAQAFGGHGVAPTTLAGERIAAGIAEGDLRWREFERYGLVSAVKPAGFLGAQVSYWWANAKDAWKDRLER